MPNRCAQADRVSPDDLMRSENIAPVVSQRTLPVKFVVRAPRNVLCQIIAYTPPRADNAAMKLNIPPILALRGLSQTDLANGIGVNRSYISELISGRKEPSFEILRKLGTFLQVPVAALIDDPLATRAPTQAPETTPDHQPPTTPDHQPPGFRETQAEPFTFRESAPPSMAKDVFKALSSAAAHPVSYRATGAIPAFSMCPGDILVVDLATPGRDGDLILVGLTDANGFNAVTLVRKLHGTFALAANPTDPTPVIDMAGDPRAAWRGTIKGLIRDTV